MITYQLQDRVFKLIDGSDKEFTFPNRLTLKIEYSPPEVFGTSDAPSRLGILHSNVTLLYDANIGRVRCQSKPPLNPLDVQVEMPDYKIELKGTFLYIDTICHDWKQLNDIVWSFTYIFPALLNIGFADPPTVSCVEGELGNTKFRWEHQLTSSTFSVKAQEQIELHVINSLKRIRHINNRLFSAIQYFYTASRLIVAGHSNWEFMAECILNLCKTLQILFGYEMDDVRKGLPSLGYKKDEIETIFIPVMCLRNHFDVGHAQKSYPNSKQIQILYQYLMGIEGHFRTLFERLFESLEQGNDLLHEEENMGFDRNKQKKFDRIIDSIAKGMKKVR